MFTNPSFGDDDKTPQSRVVRTAASLRAAWDELPPPAKLLVQSGALAVAAPLLSRAAKRLDVHASALLQSAQGL